jgi:flagellar biosynthesis protein FlhG
MFGRDGVGSAKASPLTHREATSVAVASGKGGTGKSFVATSLAVVLHQKLRQVTLVDCDFGLASDHLLLGVRPQQTLQHALAANATLAEVRTATPAGPKLVPGGSGILKMADLSDRQLLALARLLGEAAATEDVMLLDVGAGIAPQSMLTLLCADHVVMVTQPEIAALTDAYAVIKCAARLRPTCRFSVVVNRVMSPGQGEATFEKLEQVAERYADVDLSFLGEVGENPMVTQRRLGQQPLVVSDPGCVTARELHAIADRLAEVIGPLTARNVDVESNLEARFREHRLFLT